MKKLPSYLKGLVESRARSAGDIERLQELRRLLDVEIENARTRLQSADTLIRDFNPLLDPSRIQPVQSRKAPYGKLREAVRLILQGAAPTALPTSEVAFLVAEKLELRFHTVADFRSWTKNAVHRELRKQTETGTLERLPIAGEENRWRAVAAGTAGTLSDLRAVGFSAPAHAS